MSCGSVPSEEFVEVFKHDNGHETNAARCMYACSAKCLQLVSSKIIRHKIN